jgi:lipoprotein-releasing system permease protein
MNFGLITKIAWRYLRGKGSQNAVPILSKISITAIAVSSCAMIILFSVFNGFERLIDEMYHSFYPELKVTPLNGKFFSVNSTDSLKISKINGITNLSYVIEDKALINVEDGEALPITLKGVDAQYLNVHPLKPYIVEGVPTLLDGNNPTAIIGKHIAYNMGIDVTHAFTRIGLYYPNTSATMSNVLNSMSAFESVIVKPEGMFAVQDEFDSKYVLVGLSTAQQLMNREGKVSAIDLSISHEGAIDHIKEQIIKILGNQFKVETRFQQNKTIFMVTQSEKWAGYVIFTFVMIIASFNMVSAISLLVLEKKQDIGILKTMGISNTTVSVVVLMEGALWGLLGGVIGVSFGVLLCFLQMQFGWIKLGGNFVIDAYPVVVHLMDTILVLITVTIVGLLAALYPAMKSRTIGTESLVNNHL